MSSANDGSSGPPFHMSPDEFRRVGRQVVEWIAAYMESVEKYPVLSRVEPGQVIAQLPDRAPMSGEDWDTILKDVEEIILPGVTHWQSPSFFAFFPANASGPSMLGELLSAGLGVQGMLWATSPACTELEVQLMDWLVHLLGLPTRFLFEEGGGGVIQDTASSASFCALIAARERATGYRSNQSGTNERLICYASSQSHSSIEKAVRLAGLGDENLRVIPVDDQGAMLPEALKEQIEIDIAHGFKPCFVSATVGTTSSNAMDPLDAIGRICADFSIWFHVDAAMSGTAAVCPEFRWIHEGLEWADSYCFNPHKWMFVNFDCDCLFVSDRNTFVGALAVSPLMSVSTKEEVQMPPEPPAVAHPKVDYRDWQIPLGRRFRSLKLWFVLRHYGVEGLQHHIRAHVRLAQQFGEWVGQHPQFELMAPAPLNLVCFRHVDGDEVNLEIRDRLNASGKAYLVDTRIRGSVALRFCVGQTYTEFRHVRAAWDQVCALANEITGT